MPDSNINRLELFPLSTEIFRRDDQARLAIAGLDLVELAERFKTPLYLYDQATIETNIRLYRNSLAEFYPGESALTYAGKAYLGLAIARWMANQGLSIDCTGIGEITIAVAAGVLRDQILVHGVNKSKADLDAAVQHAGTIVVDNQAELSHLVNLKKSRGDNFPRLWLRLKPGLAVDTHAHRQTGQADSKFGFGPEEFLEAVEYCLANGLPLIGAHFHQGSHFHDPGPLQPALAVTIQLLAIARKQHGWIAQVLSPGGGWGVPYHEDDLPHPPIKDYVQFLAAHLTAACQQHDYPLPRLQPEPGRSLVAQAGVAVYRVGEVKTTGQRRWILLDGGIADNPRPALYGAKYSALPVIEPDRPAVGPAWLAGPYCESGDVLINELPLAAVQQGELIAVPVSGAYHISMSSNYNGAQKPAVLWLEKGQAHLIQQRETLADLYRRDLFITQAEN